MGPGARFDPVWTLMCGLAILEVVVVLVLVLPMPSNALRGTIHGGLSSLWRSQEYVRKTSWILLTLNAYYAYDAVTSLLEHNKVASASCESAAMHLLYERNLLISGGSCFLFFVMRRLLDIQGQLYQMRELAKAAAAAQKKALGSGSSGGDATQHAEVASALSRLARASTDDDSGPAAEKQD